LLEPSRARRPPLRSGVHRFPSDNFRPVAQVAGFEEIGLAGLEARCPADKTNQMTENLMAEETVVPEAERVGKTIDHDAYSDLVRRLSQQSVMKHFDAYADIEWDDPGFRIDPDDPRWELEPDDVLGATEWYRSQPAEIRSRMGLRMLANFMKIGVLFEYVLKRGLLDFAIRLPTGSQEFRYCYHETIEEAQHALMFQEFINRTGFKLPGLSGLERRGADFVVKYARKFPELFFVFVLAGEDPIDYVQRQMLRRSRKHIHPLLRRIMQAHVIEEARHMSFARHNLRKRVPELSINRRRRLSVCVPLILGIMGRVMMQASPQIAREYHIPPEVVNAAYRKNPIHRMRMHGASAKLFGLCDELGLMNRWSVCLWRMMRILPESEAFISTATE
jgi:P-aminobenzoate N-oxygenase AurF